ncbi:hypothetical protein WA026_014903 [Henosepilachna vigintioctopunctata]|uniref:Arrestin C-terminal-like domain-containing protein n=1 Tax=Henosepilachna vigintioctopunctata TaxID=420089 RepID=A0AAW1V058_9CUCU
MACQIVVDTPGPYYSGSPIQGNLICTFNDSKKIRGIKIRAYGDEHTEWWGTESYYNHVEKRHETRSVTYTGDNNLYSMEIMLFGSQNGNTHIGPGRFTYPFSFHLPPNLPSTFENSNGYIRYTLKGIVDVPWGTDYEDKIHFVLASLIDLNNFPLESFQPVSRSDEKTICCWCCAGGEITVNINVNKTAFVPNESVKLYVALTNMSNSNVEGLQARLVQYIKSSVYSPSHETKTDENTLVEDTWSGVGAHGENNYDIQLPIPSDIFVPNLDRSTLFEVSYDIEITAAISGCHSDIDLSFSVNLGHIQHQSQVVGNLASTGIIPTSPFVPPPMEGGGYPQPYNGGNYPYPPVGQPNAPPPEGPPYPSQPVPTNSYPSGPPGPYPSVQPSPYPSGGNGFMPMAPGASAPPSSIPQPTGPAGYTFANPGGPSDKVTYPGGQPSAPNVAAPYSSMSPQALSKEMEASQGGKPSAPQSEPPPPSYEDVLKKM